MADVAGILLAAGASMRLGQPKQLLLYEGRPLVRRVAEVGLAAGLAPLVVVTGAAGDAVAAALRGLAVRIVPNPRYREGQSTSLRAGVLALPPESEAAVLLLVDMPAVDASVVGAVVDAWRGSRAPIVRPSFNREPGNPVLFAAELFQELAAVQGDQGGRPVLQRHGAAVQLVPTRQAGVLEDIDTWEAYQALLASQTDGGPSSAAAERR